MNDEQSNRYQTYLLRLWRAQCRGTWQWRASLESRHTGERQLFASLEQLFAFLGERCDSQTPGAPDACPEGSSGHMRRTKSALLADHARVNTQRRNP
jgi:hypothetical protein